MCVKLLLVVSHERGQCVGGQSRLVHQNGPQHLVQTGLAIAGQDALKGRWSATTATAAGRWPHRDGIDGRILLVQ